MKRIERLRNRVARTQPDPSPPAGAQVPTYPPLPPEVPAGWIVGPPDYVGVGVQRAGTTWWFASLAQHPGIQPNAYKEIHFFDRFWSDPAPSDLATQYARYFPRADGKLAGEWTPRYMCDYWTPPLLGAAAPEARLVVMLRDPVDRYRSGLAHDMPFVADYPEPIRLTVASTAVSRGFYHGQLAALLRHFARSRVLVLQMERCRLEPDTQLARTFDFLGLQPAPQLQPLTVPINALTDAPPDLSAGQHTELAEYYRDDLTKLLADFGSDIDPSLWPTCARLSLT